MSRQDEEFWMLKIASYFVSDLNTKITAINTEKGNDADMLTLNANAFLYGKQTGFPNYNPFVVFDLDITDSADRDTDTSHATTQATMLVHLVYSHNNLHGLVPIKLNARYKRALYEVILGRHNELNYINYKIIGSVLDSFNENNKFYNQVSIGIEYQVAY